MQSSSDTAAVTNDSTTIEVKKRTLEKLKRLRDPIFDRNWSQVIERLIEGGEGVVYFKFLSIDGLLAESSDHEVVFQVGDDPPNYYIYRNGKTTEIGAKLPKISIITSGLATPK